MGGKKEWFEEFFDGMYLRYLSHQWPRERTLAQAKMIRRLLGARRGARVLDVACGYGRLTLPLAGTGLTMTGVDLAEGYVRRAKRDARREGAEARFVCGDMRAMEFDAEFDGAFCWFTSFGYFGDRENLETLKRVRER